MYNTDTFTTQEKTVKLLTGVYIATPPFNYLRHTFYGVICSKILLIFVQPQEKNTSNRFSKTLIYIQ